MPCQGKKCALASMKQTVKSWADFWVAVKNISQKYRARNSTQSNMEKERKGWVRRIKKERHFNFVKVSTHLNVFKQSTDILGVL